MSTEFDSVFSEDFRLANGATASVDANAKRVWVFVEHEQEYEYEPPSPSSLSIEETERLIAVLQRAVRVMKNASKGD